MSMISPSPLCLLPTSVRRDQTGPAMAIAAAAGNQTVRILPELVRRTSAATMAQSYALGASGVHCSLPQARARSMGAEMPMRVAMPFEVSRADTLPTPGAAPPVPPAPSVTVAPPVQAALSLEALFPIVERVARGISGAAGYRYMGEDPDGAGLRYGLLGLRLDTGDMGQVLALARDRNEAGFAAALGEHAATLLSTVNASNPTARKMPVAGTPLWTEPWKSTLSRVAEQDIFRAAQNEYATSWLLMPAADLVLAQPGLASGVSLAMALDLLAEMGRETGMIALQSALATGPTTPAALKVALTAACPSCRLRLEDLARDKALADWRPNGALTAGPAARA